MHAQKRTREFFDLYTKDFSAADFQLLVTRDTNDTYCFFARHIDQAAFKDLPPLKLRRPRSQRRIQIIAKQPMWGPDGPQGITVGTALDATAQTYLAAGGRPIAVDADLSGGAVSPEPMV